MISVNTRLDRIVGFAAQEACRRSIKSASTQVAGGLISYRQSLRRRPDDDVAFVEGSLLNFG